MGSSDLVDETIWINRGKPNQRDRGGNQGRELDGTGSGKEHQPKQAERSYHPESNRAEQVTTPDERTVDSGGR